MKTEIFVVIEEESSYQTDGDTAVTTLMAAYPTRDEAITDRNTRNNQNRNGTVEYSVENVIFNGTIGT